VRASEQENCCPKTRDNRYYTFYPDEATAVPFGTQQSFRLECDEDIYRAQLETLCADGKVPAQKIYEDVEV
jgi:hypothetical protein